MFKHNQTGRVQSSTSVWDIAETLTENLIRTIITQYLKMTTLQCQLNKRFMKLMGEYENLTLNNFVVQMAAGCKCRAVTSAHSPQAVCRARYMTYDLSSKTPLKGTVWISPEEAVETLMSHRCLYETEIRLKLNKNNNKKKTLCGL